MIVLGADTHKVSHTVAAVEEATGREIAEHTVKAKRRSFEDLLRWGRGLGEERVWAIEDCRHVSGALERFLLARGERVVRVPPKLMAGARKSSRERGKSDAIDAVAIARAAIREGLDTLPVAQLAGPDDDEGYELAGITRIDFGGQYEDALWQVAPGSRRAALVKGSLTWRLCEATSSYVPLAHRRHICHLRSMGLSHISCSRRSLSTMRYKNYNSPYRPLSTKAGPPSFKRHNLIESCSRFVGDVHDGRAVEAGMYGREPRISARDHIIALIRGEIPE